MICDYFVIRQTVLHVDDLYLRGGRYEYSRGFNWRAVIALALGAGAALSGFADPTDAIPLRLFVVRRIRRFVRGVSRPDAAPENSEPADVVNEMMSS